MAANRTKVVNHFRIVVSDYREHVPGVSSYVQHSPEIPPGKCIALGWRKFLLVEKLINKGDHDRN
jgi:hypothetical protein